jgi:hypothetical protein
MENNQQTFIRADDNYIINEKFIRWIKKMDECLIVCSKQNGCIINTNTHKICKLNNLYSYNKLNDLFKN